MKTQGGYASTWPASTPTAKMRHRVHIQAPDDTTTKGSTAEGYDSAGETAWWASIEPVRGDEFTLADKIEGTTTFRVNMNYFDGLTQQHRIRWGTRYLNIRVMRSIDEIDREHELICVEAD